MSFGSVVQWTADPINPGDQMQPGEKKGGPGFDSWLNQELFFKNAMYCRFCYSELLPHPLVSR